MKAKNRAIEPRGDYQILGEAKKSVKCVFISHQSDDKDHARIMAEEFLNAGIDVYFDEHDTTLNAARERGDWDTVNKLLKAGIRQSSHMLALVSRSTKDSEWVPYEVGYGQEPCIVKAVLIKGLKKHEAPEYLQSDNTIVSEDQLERLGRGINESVGYGTKLFSYRMSNVFKQ